ncbi:hypothetical protein VRU48_17500 [Pedobacter sp. KR3-3]|uniref:Lipoprotein n=1 Tax=Pedobacter albus TaxID=3113905 RepID=A0ABU7IC32_9SPHI|nr:hypothetical protein [Pedobacter sp. KR3-3]MEE1946926.1 hypothetical protein [Pedobacter sp. KR3-3]
MRYKYILFLIILLIGCQQKREVNTTFYYWKTVYKQNADESKYLQQLHSKRLYVRIMDVDGRSEPIPVAPISFADPLPDTLGIIPVVYIVNEVFKEKTDEQVKRLASNVMRFVKGKVAQAGKKGYRELQLDCDWTASTKKQYFLFLTEVAKLNADRQLSATLRLHQLKNQASMGIPPVNKVLLMCYNMGNLRKYGKQNSILEIAELQKYAGKNLGYYPMPIDVGLPLFSWAVAFRGGQYIGIAKRLELNDLKDPALFGLDAEGLYQAKTDLPQFGLKKNDEIRYEESKPAEVREVAQYLSRYLSEKPLNLVFYHLDSTILKNYPPHELEKIGDLLR